MHLAVGLGFCFIFMHADANQIHTDTSDPSKFLKCAQQYCLSKNYSKLYEPFDSKGKVDVSVDLDVLQILEVDDIKFTVSFSMYFGVRWQEPRLLSPSSHEGDNAYVAIDLGMIDFLWVPDVYIYHLKTIQVLNIFTQFAGECLNSNQQICSLTTVAIGFESRVDGTKNQHLQYVVLECNK